jgi:hypothetical protein
MPFGAIENAAGHFSTEYAVKVSRKPSLKNRGTCVAGRWPDSATTHPHPSRQNAVNRAVTQGWAIV